jgi:uncharacterized protein YdaU (DUF1376 family)
MAKDPAVLFYTSDFLSGTFTLTDEQVGKYIRLLCLQHQKGKLSAKDMLSICKAYDVDIYEKFKVEDGFYLNEKMYNETIRRQKFTESRRNNAKTTKNDSISEAHAKHMHKHMETETETITITNTINRKENFENLVLDYKSLLAESYNEFIEYWCEPSKSGKLRYEAEKFFDVKRRVNTWIKNKLKYGNTKTSSPTAASSKRMSDLASWVNS